MKIVDFQQAIDARRDDHRGATMPQILKSWRRRTGHGVKDVLGIHVTKSAVEFWRGTPEQVTGRVSLHQFHVERVRSGMEHLAGWVGKRQATEVKQFVADLMEAHRDYVD